MNNDLKTILIIGRPGSGKGTQSKKLLNYLGKENTLYLSTGQYLRDLINKNSYSGCLLDEQVMKAGTFAPSFFAIWAWGDILVNNLRESHNIILDGSPRTLLEAMALDDAFKFYNRKNINVLFIDISKETSINRLLKRGRTDDEENIIKDRLEESNKYTDEVVSFIKEKNNFNFVTINGEEDENTVFNNIKSLFL